MTMLFEETERRKDLAQFLRDRRARIAPAVAGLQIGTRRRARGLLREEVAMIAGVGVTWYTWLEQARPIRPSLRVLGGIARALRLDEAESAHLYRLARPDLEPAPKAQIALGVSPALLRTMEGLAPHPAYATNAMWDLVAWNKPAVSVFGDFARIEPDRRNILHMLFCHPDWRKLFKDWAAISALAVAQFRASTARLTAEPRLQAFIRTLEESSEEFRTQWNRRDVRLPTACSKVLEHPSASRLHLDYATFQPDGGQDVRLTIYTPGDRPSAERLAALAKRPPRLSRRPRSADGQAASAS